MEKFNVIIDTREQQPLTFWSSAIELAIVSKLDTGDYSIQGMEDILCIERKGSLVEFYNNVSDKRFWREMERMEKFKYKFLVLEFSVSDVDNFPDSVDVPQAVKDGFRLSKKFLMRAISDIQIKYGIHVVFAETRGLSSYLITNIMRRVHEYESLQTTD